MSSTAVLGDDSPLCSPDPFLTASIYCAGSLDLLIRQVIHPWWHGCFEKWVSPTDGGYLWMMRYQRRGEHLKLRIHASEDHRGVLQRELVASTHTFFESLPAPTDLEEPPWQAMPPIDVEDRLETRHPDRALLWTRYARSHVCMGGEPFLSDDRHAHLFTAALGRSCELIFDIYAAVPEGAPIGQRLSTSWLQILLPGLSALGMSEAELQDYLIYHRDWLIRFPLIKNGQGGAKAAAILDSFGARVTRMGAAIEGLRAALERVLGDGGADPDGWPGAAAALAHRAAELAAVHPGAGDSYAAEPFFPSAFKLFHMAANPLGFHFLEEAYLYHLLLKAAWPAHVDGPIAGLEDAA